MIWENGVSVAKVQKEDQLFTCVKFSKELRFEEVKDGLNEKELYENLEEWNMKPTDKKLVLEMCNEC